MLQILTDDKIKDSKDAQLFIKALKKECLSQNVDCTLTDIINTDELFIIPYPNNLSKEAIELLTEHHNNVETHVNISKVVVDVVQLIADCNKIFIEGRLNVVIFGGSGKIATSIVKELNSRVSNNCFNIGKIKVISSKTHQCDIPIAIKQSNIIISAIPFGKELVIDLYNNRLPKTVIDVGNNLSNNRNKPSLYFSYSNIGNTLTKKIVKHVKNRRFYY